jgi:N-methylhydantoinase A
MLDEAEHVVRRAAKDAELSRSAKAFMRYRGQGHEITVNLDLNEIFQMPSPDASHLRKVFEEAFVDEYRRVYGREITGLAVEALSWVVTVTSIQEERAIENGERPKKA